MQQRSIGVRDIKVFYKPIVCSTCILPYSSVSYTVKTCKNATKTSEPRPPICYFTSDGKPSSFFDDSDDGAPNGVWRDKPDEIGSRHNGPATSAAARVVLCCNEGAARARRGQSWTVVICGASLQPGRLRDAVGFWPEQALRTEANAAKGPRLWFRSSAVTSRWKQRDADCSRAES